MRGLATAAMLIVVLTAVSPLAEAQDAVGYRAREPVVLHGDVGVDATAPFVAHVPLEGAEHAWDLTADTVTVTILTCTNMFWSECQTDETHRLRDARVWVEDPDEERPLLYRATEADGTIVASGGNVTTLEGSGDNDHGSPAMLPAQGYVLDTLRLATHVDAATVLAELHGGRIMWEGEDATSGETTTRTFNDAGPYGGGFFSGYRYVEVRAESATVETLGPGSVTEAEPTMTATDGATLTLAEGSTTLPETLTLSVVDDEVDEATGDRWLLLEVQIGAALVPTSMEDGDADAGPLATAGAYGLAIAGLGGLGVAVWYSPYLRWLATASVVPLYSRIKSGEVMDHETREEIYALVQEHPGIHAQEIRARTGVGWGTAVYHLKLLEEHKLVVSERQGRYKRFFLSAGYTGRKKEVYGVLRNESTARVAHFVSAHPGCIQREVCEALDMSPSLVTWHIKKLEEAQLVKKVRDGRRVHYYAGPAWDNVDLTDSQLAFAEQAAASG